MDVAELLEAASLLVPEGRAGANDLTLADVWDLLAGDEWEVTLGVLEELRNGPALPPDFWARMAGAAEEMRLERSAAWCRWRRSEALYGTMRAELTLGRGRRAPVPGAGALRPMWDIGNRGPAGEPALNVAALWVERAPFLPPGGHATVRLAPLDPAQWRHIRPGQVITMHERRPVAGTAVVLEVQAPYSALGGSSRT